MARFIKPTQETQFHIDFDWWKTKGQNLRSQLMRHLCEECAPAVEQLPAQEMDWIDPETGEVQQIDAIWDRLYTHCSRKPNFLSNVTALTTMIFRLFIINNNRPMTPSEMEHKLISKSSSTILGTIGGHTVYNGIRPVNYPNGRKEK